MSEWDRRFLNLAAEISDWSKDPSTKVGAVLVDHKRRVVGTGYNGYPRNIADELLSRRDYKLAHTVHAEVNALLNSLRDVDGCTLYVTHPPCSSCAVVMAQAGIKRVVTYVPATQFADRWGDQGIQILKKAGIEYEERL